MAKYYPDWIGDKAMQEAQEQRLLLESRRWWAVGLLVGVPAAVFAALLGAALACWLVVR